MSVQFIDVEDRRWMFFSYNAEWLTFEYDSCLIKIEYTDKLLHCFPYRFVF